MSDKQQKIAPQVARDNANEMRIIADRIETLLNDVSNKMMLINDGETEIYDGYKKPSELRGELDQFRQTFHITHSSPYWIISPYGGSVIIKSTDFSGNCIAFASQYKAIPEIELENETLLLNLYCFKYVSLELNALANSITVWLYSLARSLIIPFITSFDSKCLFKASVPLDS